MVRQNEVDNYSRWRPGNTKGLYESYFLRGNAPDGPRAFWIKYTIFAPKGRPHNAEGELWTVFFEGAEGTKVATKEVVPLRSCLFAADRFEVRVGKATLTDGSATGVCTSGGRRIEWDLEYPTAGPPLHFLPEWAYGRSLPKAKGLTPYPDVTWKGKLAVDGERIDVTGWKGSQNHNWGEKHTDQYAWAQCNSFEGHPGSYMEMMSARLRLGPVWTPYISFLALHHEGQDYLFNRPACLLRAKASFPARLEWHLSTRDGAFEARCKVAARKETFAGLRYRNPPGGEHACLNSKIASSEIRLLRKGREIVRLVSPFATAFEILTDDPAYGVPILI
ncbi:MAG: tocopherol cyclase family protein [bacterium]